MRAMQEVVIGVVKLDPRDPSGDEILDGLVQRASFWSAGPDDIEGDRGQWIHVGAVEGQAEARKAIADVLGDVTPRWREYLRIL
jgi:hypothetical protein